MRDTEYATELATAALSNGNEEVRIERLRIKTSGQEEIRFSWWKNGNLIMRPLDLPEDQLLSLMQRAARGGVFTPEFVAQLKASL